ncbi:MAG: hypothetical protein RLZZ217_1434 [Planctomycetota bacterium]|jgi:hypothetical protein
MSEACPFTMLGIVPAWPVPAADVHRARLAAAARLHPDRARDAAEREALERRMAAMNESADRLLDPVRAAGALLAALGAPSTELPLPPMELAELLERREWIEERHGGHDAARAEVLAWITAERNALVSAFGAAVERGRTNGEWDEARRGIARLRAHARVTDQAGAQRG